MPPRTVESLLRRLSAWLSARGIASARLDAELMLAHVLRCPRLQLYLRWQQSLEESVITACRELAQQRGKRRPLSHILGQADFWGLVLQAGPAALTPRTETELLVEQTLRALDDPSTPQGWVLEWGTGSAAIGLAVCSERTQLRWLAVELSPQALQLAAANLQQHQHLLAERSNQLLLFQGNGFHAVAPAANIALIVSNPPYIPSQQLPSLMPEVQYDPPLALDGGTDGMQYHRLLIQEAAQRLAPQGKLLLEIAHDQAPAIQAVLQQYRFAAITTHQDFLEHPRVVTATKGV